MTGKARTYGFTLIELMFAVAIATVLSLIAIPAYNRFIDEARNKAAIGDVLAIQSEIERFHTLHSCYPASLADLASKLPNNGRDPWDKDYVYLNIANGGPGIKGQVRKDKHLNPLNTDYDLYSMGKDGVTKKQLDNKDSVDDIVRARNGGFVGLSSDF
jgi:general secretion pathway protein G